MALARDRLRLVTQTAKMQNSSSCAFGKTDTDCQNTTFLELWMDEDLDGTKMHSIYNKNSNIAERGTQWAHKIYCSSYYTPVNVGG